MYHANDGNTYRNAAHFELAQTLAGEGSKRRDKPPEQWIVDERAAMLTVVNVHRARAGKSSLSLVDVERVEGCACGHSDYARKFSLYCAELINA